MKKQNELVEFIDAHWDNWLLYFPGFPNPMQISISLVYNYIFLIFFFAIVQSTVSDLLKDSNPLGLEWKSPGSSSSLKYCPRRGSKRCPLAWEHGMLPLDQLDLLFEEVYFISMIVPVCLNFWKLRWLTPLLCQSKTYQISFLLLQSSFFQFDLFYVFFSILNSLLQILRSVPKTKLWYFCGFTNIEMEHFEAIFPYVRWWIGGVSLLDGNH